MSGPGRPIAVKLISANTSLWSARSGRSSPLGCSVVACAGSGKWTTARRGLRRQAGSQSPTGWRDLPATPSPSGTTPHRFEGRRVDDGVRRIGDRSGAEGTATEAVVGRVASALDRAGNTSGRVTKKDVTFFLTHSSRIVIRPAMLRMCDGGSGIGGSWLTRNSKCRR